MSNKEIVRIGGDALKRASAGLPGINSKDRMKGRTVYFSEDVLSALEEITRPLDIKHDSPHVDMVKNVVLSEIRMKIKSCALRGKY